MIEHLSIHLLKIQVVSNVMSCRLGIAYHSMYRLVTFSRFILHCIPEYVNLCQQCSENREICICVCVRASLLSTVAHSLR